MAERKSETFVQSIKMKIQSLLKALVIGASLSAGSLFANTVTVYHTDNQGGLHAGEFLAKSDIGDFLTFCLEKEVKIVTGKEYTYTIESKALGGGKNDQAEVGDTISQGTAFLYTAFLNGTLGDSDGVGSYVDNNDLNAGLLQLAIWALEDEDVADQTNNFYYNLAQTEFMGNAHDDYTGSQVRVMNPWGESGEDIQSILFSVPDGATTSVLLGLGLVSLAVLRRKF